MRVHLDRVWQAKLADLPESGMGSQHVDIILNDGRILRDVPVFNGEDCEISEPFNPSDVKDIRVHSH